MSTCLQNASLHCWPERTRYGLTYSFLNYLWFVTDSSILSNHITCIRKEKYHHIIMKRLLIYSSWKVLFTAPFKRDIISAGSCSQFISYVESIKKKWLHHFKQCPGFKCYYIPIIFVSFSVSTRWQWLT